MSDNIQFETLEAFMEHLEHVWKFNQATYPRMPDPATPGYEIGVYAFAHILAHMMKSTGALAALLEEYDHTNVTDWFYGQEAHALVRKQFANTLRMAQMIGMQLSDLLSVEQ